MLPTLLGRWQTRILLFFFIGLPITFLYMLWLGNSSSQYEVAWVRWPIEIVPFQVICMVFVVGAILDPVYVEIQRYRWDRDWPFAYQFFFSIVEFVIVLGLIKLDVLPFLPARTLLNGENYFYVSLHFALVFLPAFIALLGFVQIFMVRWRYKGGEWGRL
jgi:hypothetical protein